MRGTSQFHASTGISSVGPRLLPLWLTLTCHVSPSLETWKSSLTCFPSLTTQWVLYAYHQGGQRSSSPLSCKIGLSLHFWSCSHPGPLLLSQAEQPKSRLDHPGIESLHWLPGEARLNFLMWFIGLLGFPLASTPSPQSFSSHLSLFLSVCSSAMHLLVLRGPCACSLLCLSGLPSTFQLGNSYSLLKTMSSPPENLL